MMKRTSQSRVTCVVFTLVAIGLVASSVIAAPAYWYRWQSITTKKIICKQTDPGKGWQQMQGKYLDAACRIAKKPTP